jgi:dTDP-4-dehydrorhamnose 3,5-epimerase
VRVTELSIDGLFVLESPVWSDDRGFFREWYKREDLQAQGIEFEIRQANLSMSKRNVVRGLHYSRAALGQAKLVTCAYGELDDVIVDVRVGSPTFARSEKVHLVAGDERSVLLPEGVAHGFCVTSELGALTYLLSSPYDPANEFEINPFDEALRVTWPLSDKAIVSEKDGAAPTLEARRQANELPLFTRTND